MIESIHNSTVKELRSLCIKKYRDRQGLFIVEGSRFVQEIPEDFTIRYYVAAEHFMRKKMELPLRDRIPVHVLTDKLFKTVSDTETPQGILALVERKQWNIPNLIKHLNGPAVVLDQVNDPGNLGTILRTADAAGFKAAFISQSSADLYNPKTLRSTMGSVFHLPVVSNVNLAEIYQHFQHNAMPIMATAPEGKETYFNIQYPQRYVIVIGNEARGISTETRNAADILLSIPMLGKAESLNASIAAGLVLYEGIRTKLKG